MTQQFAVQAYLDQSGIDRVRQATQFIRYVFVDDPVERPRLRENEKLAVGVYIDKHAVMRVVDVLIQGRVDLAEWTDLDAAKLCRAATIITESRSPAAVNSGEHPEWPIFGD
jgi:hypothetical protein